MLEPECGCTPRGWAAFAAMLPPVLRDNKAKTLAARRSASVPLVSRAEATTSPTHDLGALPAVSPKFAQELKRAALSPNLDYVKSFKRGSFIKHIENSTHVRCTSSGVVFYKRDVGATLAVEKELTRARDWMVNEPRSLDERIQSELSATTARSVSSPLRAASSLSPSSPTFLTSTELESRSGTSPVPLLLGSKPLDRTLPSIGSKDLLEQVYRRRELATIPRKPLPPPSPQYVPSQCSLLPESLRVLGLKCPDTFRCIECEDSDLLPFAENMKRVCDFYLFRERDNPTVVSNMLASFATDFALSPNIVSSVIVTRVSMGGVVVLLLAVLTPPAWILGAAGCGTERVAQPLVWAPCPAAVGLVQLGGLRVALAGPWGCGRQPGA